jgi:hypothetical protein
MIKKNILQNYIKSISTIVFNQKQVWFVALTILLLIYIFLKNNINYSNKLTFKEETSTYSYNINIPEITLEGKDISQLNQYIKLYSTTKINQLKSLAEDLKENPHDFNLNLSINYEIYTSNLNILSIKIIANSIDTKEHSEITTYNIYLKNSTLIDFNDIFSSSIYIFLTNYIQKTLKDKILLEEITVNTDKIFFYFKDNTLFIIYPEYVLSPLIKDQTIIEITEKNYIYIFLKIF